MCARKGGGQCPAVTGDNRYHAILGGKKCFAVCPSDMAVALTALDARLRIFGPGGERLLNVIDLYNPMGNNLSSGEIITEILIPRQESGSRHLFIKHRVRESMDFAIVSLGLVCTLRKKICSNVRIVLGAVAPGPYRAKQAEDVLSGRKLENGTIEAAANAAVAGTIPLSRNAYKIEIARSIVKRALFMMAVP